jgi:arylsulfatase A-like enzyme
MCRLREAGLRTATISSFAERHSAWHWLAGFSEFYNTGRRGMERADEVAPVAIEWLRRNGRHEDWLLHVNFWDPHTPYRTPLEFGSPYENDPPPEWLTEEVRAEHWYRCGPHSAQEMPGYNDDVSVYPGALPRQPARIDSLAAAKKMFDGYDVGVRYADDYIGQILDTLEELGIGDTTVVIITADHGENLGELNVYGDHQTADQITARVPVIVRWPGITGSQAGRVDRALHYQFDFAATVLELIGASVPHGWDAVSFADSLRTGGESGRDYLVLSHGAWTCQRGVRFRSGRRDYICIRTYHDGHHGFSNVMLFDLKYDPHEQFNLAVKRPDLVQEAMLLLEQWHAGMMQSSESDIDPLWNVIREGGPYHTRGELPAYLQRLRETDRGDWADLLEARHFKHGALPM